MRGEEYLLAWTFFTSLAFVAAETRPTDLIPEASSIYGAPLRFLGRREHRKDKPTPNPPPRLEDIIDIPDIEGQDRTVQAILDRFKYLEARRAQEEAIDRFAAFPVSADATALAEEPSIPVTVAEGQSRNTRSARKERRQEKRLGRRGD